MGKPAKHTANQPAGPVRGFDPEQPPTRSTIPLPSDADPPHSIEAELGVLGAAMYDNQWIAPMAEIVRPTDMWRHDHSTLWACITELHKNAPIDLITLDDYLECNRPYDKPRLMEIITEASKALKTPSHGPYYASVVLRHAQARAAIDIADTISRAAYAKEADPDDVIAEAIASLRSLQGRGRGGPPTISFADIDPVELQWLWPRRIPRKCITLLAGMGGLGKTWVALWIASQVSRGGTCPDDPAASMPLGDTIYISTEDDLEDTIRPRLDSLGADVTRIHTLQYAAVSRLTLADLSPIERALAAVPNPQLLVIDPPTAHLGNTDDHKNSELRALLYPLRELAARWNIAVLLVTHTAKAETRNAASRVLGSVAWTNVARAAWMFFKDQEDRGRVLMASVKSNLGPSTDGLAFRLLRDPTRIEWEAAGIALDADDLNADGGHGNVKVRRAAAWLKEYLADYARPSKTVFAAGKEQGFPKGLLYKAKELAGVEARSGDFRGVWHWGLGDPADWILEPEPGEDDEAVPF